MPFLPLKVTTNDKEGRNENGRDPPLKEYLYTFKSPFIIHIFVFRCMDDYVAVSGLETPLAEHSELRARVGRPQTS